MEFEEAIDTVGRTVEAAGVAIIVLGALLATLRFLVGWRGAGEFAEAYRGYRQGVARAILLGLEFLVAADIIQTVTTTPTFRDVGVLALIVLLRTFLSVSLTVEVEGRWPWQSGGHAGDDALMRSEEEQR